MDSTIVLGVVMFTGTVLALVGVILMARAKLVSAGDVTLSINGEKSVTVPAGGKLLGTLAEQGIYLSSACGGGGSCGQCRCQVLDGGGSMLSTEEGHFTRSEAREDWRLSCQVAVKQDMAIKVPEDALGCSAGSAPWSPTRTWPPSSRSSCQASGRGERRFPRRGFVQLEIPPYAMSYEQDIDVQPEFREDWDKFKIWRYTSKVTEPTIRAYSMANYPEEKGVLKFNIRVATPPPGRDDVPCRENVFLRFLPEARRQGDRIWPLRRFLRKGDRSGEDLDRRRGGYGTDALADF